MIQFKSNIFLYVGTHIAFWVLHAVKEKVLYFNLKPFLILRILRKKRKSEFHLSNLNFIFQKTRRYR